MMRPFVPELPQINPRWITSWSERLGIENVATAMLSNERVSSRVHRDILGEMKIDTTERFDDDLLMAATQYLEDRGKLALLCGLVLHVDELREKVTKEDFNSLSRMFDPQLLKLAVSLSHLRPAGSAFHTEQSRFAELVERSGRACIVAWKGGVNEQMAIRLELIDSQEESDEEYAVMPQTDVATRIVVEASRKLLANSVKQLS